MAQPAKGTRAASKRKSKSTKTRTSASRSNGGGTVKSRAKTSASRSRTQSAAKKKSANTKSRSTASSRGAKSASRNGGLAQKAKGPAVAAGAMLLGLAGVAARNAKRSRSRLPRLKLSLPRPKSMSLPKSGGSTVAWVGEKAKEVGDAGYRVADLTSEAAKVEKSLRKG